MIDLVPLGDRAWLARFATEAEAQDWGASVREQRWAGVVEVSVAYASAAVFVDPDRVDPEPLEARLRRLRPTATARQAGRLIRVPVLYEGDDLEAIAAQIQSTRSAVIAAHAGQEYQVFALGFLPGFPYAGYLSPKLAGLPRRSRPRVQVPAGSVALAGRQTGIYPSASPGGWWLLGRTPLCLVDLARGFLPIRVGDRLRFEPIEESEFQARLGEDLCPDE